MSWDVRPTLGRSVSSSSSSTSLHAQLNDDRATITRRRRATSANDDEGDPWGSMEDLASPSDAAHPLSSSSKNRRTSSVSSAGKESIANASRPNLARLTSEVEREVAAANAASRSSIDDGSIRGSLDLLRNSLSPSPKGDVEVLVHAVKPGESIAGIALQYGIDLATIRKVNKLWPTDPVSLRRTLYIPLEACRWGKSTQSVVRGPLENQITLVQKGGGVDAGSGGSRKGKEREVENGEHSGQGYVYNGQRRSSVSRGQGAAGRFLPSTNIAYGGVSEMSGGSDIAAMVPGPRTAPPEKDEPIPDRILDIIRIPASELAFFPKAKGVVARKSLDAYSAAERDKRSSEKPGIPRSNSSSSSAPISTLLNGNGRITYSKRPFAPPSMTPSSRSSIPDLRAHRNRTQALPNAPSASSSSSNPLTSRLTALFVSPPAFLDYSDPTRQSLDSPSGSSTPNTARAQDPAFELVNRDRNFRVVGAGNAGMDWFAPGDDPGKKATIYKRTSITKQPMERREMVVPGGKQEVPAPIDLTAPWD